MDGKRCSSKNENNETCWYECEKSIKYHIFKDFIWTPNICDCECNKKWKTNEYWNACTCIKRVSDNLVVTCEYDMLNTSTNSFNKKTTSKVDYYFFLTILVDIFYFCS